MNEAFYESILSGKHMMFWFESIGRESIIKAILFRPTSEPDTYKMLLGDLDPDGSINVESRSNNGDTEKVLSIAARSIVFFLSDHPEAKVVIEASTESRARLYQIAIGREMEDLGNYLNILGFHGEKPEAFQSGKNYKKIIVSLKTDQLNF
ncbi:hypothetical protein SAMN04487996_112216 [Dyadobacter soli]|uniref:Uncharacterized protein n=1 Tax=Dyadobacter soli TaxID=659014 RepID=A0A1G7NZL6_9BACT|nr:hypothetical protein [Dyadobacter soli]SDF79492.1 hypothetical protein SAMN04487996_112216 [Dyadobacter soli]